MKNGLKFILSYAKKYRVKLIIAFIISLIFVACNIAIPIISGWAIDAMKETDIDFQLVNYYILAILILTILGSVFYWFLSYFASSVSYMMAKDMRNDVMGRLMISELSSLDRMSYGDVISTLINDITIISDGVIQTFIQLFTGFFTIIGTLVLMFIFSWQLALIVFILTPLSLVVSILIAKGTAKTFANQSNYRGKLSALVNENTEGQKVIIANAHQASAQQEFDAIATDLKKYDLKAEFYGALINPTTRLINSIIYGCVAFVGAILAVKSPLLMTTGKLVTFLMFTNNYTKPFNEISSVVSELQNAYASSLRVKKLLEIPVISSDAGNYELTQSSEIKFENVSFSYTKGQNLLHDINVDIKKGMHVAIVGPTGCGKTTLINLLMRFYEIDGGDIFIGDKKIDEVSRTSLRNNIGMVLQDTWIFKGTVRENIAYAKLDATQEEIELASKRANADFFISQLENGYDTVVSDKNGLSQGQKQLLCITRLMLNTPDILILDEATSNIDTLNEKIVQEDFNKIMEGKTSIIIAHRLQTIQNADMILVLNNGTIEERGTHVELLAKGGFYSKLYNSQFAKVD